MATDRLMSAGRIKFEREKIRLKLDKAQREVLEEFGRNVASTAKANIESRSRTSRPGEGPTNQTGRLRRGIKFLYQPNNATVIVGPVIERQRLDGVGEPIPSVLETGGRALVGFGRGGPIFAIVAPRPYMGPAFAQHLPEARALWADSVR